MGVPAALGGDQALAEKVRRAGALCRAPRRRRAVCAGRRAARLFVTGKEEFIFDRACFGSVSFGVFFAIRFNLLTLRRVFYSCAGVCRSCLAHPHGTLPKLCKKSSKVLLDSSCACVFYYYAKGGLFFKRKAKHQPLAAAAAARGQRVGVELAQVRQQREQLLLVARRRRGVVARQVDARQAGLVFVFCFLFCCCCVCVVWGVCV